MPQTGIVDTATAMKMIDALRLIPNVDVGPYNEKIAQLTIQIEGLTADNQEAIGELQTMSRIILKHQPKL